MKTISNKIDPKFMLMLFIILQHWKWILFWS